MTLQDARLWQPDTTVATVVVDQGKLLMIEEHAEDRLVLNQPAGHLEPDESLLQAALRETLEESAWTVRLRHFIGAYQWKAPTGRHYLRFAFAAEPISHDPARALDEGIVRALWMTPEQLRQAHSRHRSPLVWQVVADYLAGRRYPLSALSQLP